MLNRITLSILLACAFLACKQHKAPKEVVFVCTHGAARSPIAAAYFDKLAKENDLNFQAVFRGNRTQFRTH